MFGHAMDLKRSVSKEDRVKNGVLQLIKEPVVQFVLIGACIYALYAGFGTPEQVVRENIVNVDSARIEGFVGQWQSRWNRPPTQQELDGVIDSFIREEILYRQAVAMGLDRDDPVTRRRMAQKLEFLTSDLASFQEPAPAELEEYFQAHQDRYREPDLITFSHVFINPDVHEDSTLDDAASLLRRLQAAGEPDAAALESGDRNISQSSFRNASQLDVQRQLGSGYAEAVMQLEPGQWHGPVLSGYGVHLVYVHELQQAPPPLLDEVKEVVLEDWQRENQETFNAEFYQSLKSRYEVVIAEPPAGRVLTEASEPATPDSGNAGRAARAENPSS